MEGGSAGSAERRRTQPRERGRISSTSITKAGGSPGATTGSYVHSNMSGGSSLPTIELWKLVIRWSPGASRLGSR